MAAFQFFSVAYMAIVGVVILKLLTLEFVRLFQWNLKGGLLGHHSLNVLYLSAFILLWLWRYMRLLVHLLSSWTFQPAMPKKNPTFHPEDCTIVLATIDGQGLIFSRCVDSILANTPAKLVIVVPIRGALRLAARFMNTSKVTVVGCPAANKRFQQICGLRFVTTHITVFCDDDVIWPHTFLHCTLAVFEDVSVGAGGTCQRLLREKAPGIWDFFGAAYLERRNFEFSATTHIDGGTSALSGRTQLIRTCILKSDTFMRAYLSEKWLGWLSLQNADDDNFITRWLVNHGWKIRIQYCPEAEILTTLEGTIKFIGQCVRWFRTTWRSNITSMFVEGTIWSAQPWSSYALHLSTFNPPAAILDGILVWLLHRTVSFYMPTHASFSVFLLVSWLLFTKTVKLIPHFWRYPSDLKFLPLHYAFGYLHGIIKIYALLTVGSTKWLGRKMAPETREMKFEDTVGVEGLQLMKLAHKKSDEELETAVSDFIKLQLKSSGVYIKPVS